MTLRGVFGDDVQHIQEQIDDLLDREDGLIVLFDGSRMVSYAQGFGVSPCQLELLTVAVERAIRSVIGGPSLTTGRNRRNFADSHRSRTAGRVLRLARTAASSGAG
jgi:hypothetical protein